MEKIIITNATSNNLQNVSVEIPRNKLTVITGPSGSGKSSLAFDTLYKEGQRRFLESLSSYGKTFLQSIQTPKVDSIRGLSPTVAIDQKVTSINPRSTVGTLTEIYTYLRMLYAKLGTAHSPFSGKPILPLSKEKIIEKVLKNKSGSKLVILSPILSHKKGEHRDILTKYEGLGFSKIRVNGEIQFIDEPLKADIKKYNDIDLVVDRIILKKESKPRVQSSVSKALQFSKGSVIVLNGSKEQYFSKNYFCPDSNTSFPKLDESLFSFNSPRGYCEFCQGLGSFKTIKAENIFFDKSSSLKEGPIGLFIEKDNLLKSIALKMLGTKGLETPVDELPKSKLDNFLNGKGASYKGLMSYLNYFVQDKERMTVENNLSHLITNEPCTECNGLKLNDYALGVKILNESISEVCNKSIEEFNVFIKKVEKKFKKNIIGEKILKEIIERTDYLLNIGLYYLTINRKASTLSGGEFQRIRLSAQLGSEMSGLVYVLDEPSIGLHQRDNFRLIDTLIELKKRNNTVIVVEHDEETMLRADHIIDIGPGSGVDGGKVVAQGSLKNILKSKDSITGLYLSKKYQIKVPEKRKQSKFIELKEASENNLKKINIKIPINNFVCVTGVSGSGKSSLIHKVLIPAILNSITRRYARKNNFKSIKGTKEINSLIKIDQSPIGRTPKSIPLTYCGIFTHIRTIFANTNQAKLAGMKPGDFSFNVKSGQCKGCDGHGHVKLEMPFLSNVYNKCNICQSKRYNAKVLEIKYRGLSIHDVLEMSVDEALEFFANHKKINFTLETLKNVGLGYLKLGQPSPTLSGGEAQRIKLSRELSKIKKGHCLYILDEPTTGLHFKDISLLIDSLQQLVEAGHSVVVIEHNLDVIKCSDYIIDLGLEGGKHGGEVLYQGPCNKIVKNKVSLTAKFLKPYL